MRLRTPARVFLSLIVLGAGAALAAWVVWARTQPAAGARPEGLASPADLFLAAELVAMAVVAQFLHVPVAPKHKVAISDAPYFACLLFFGAPIATVLAALGQLIGQGILALRGVRGIASVAFNTAQMVLAMSLAGVLYGTLAHPWAIPVAGGAWYLMNTASVAVMSGLHTGGRLRDMFELWAISRRRHALQVAGMLVMAWVTTRASRDPFVALLLAVPAVIVYISMRHTVQLVVQTVEAVEALSDVVDERDPYTYQHSKRVAEYAEKIARAMRLSREQVEVIRSAARVHDLGKVGIPDAVLRKPGALEEDEWALMRAHAEKGYQILSRFPEYAEGRELVRAHHERFDGKGYPRGLAGEEIRIGAQVIAVADTFDAMTTDRPYRKALPVATALEELVRGRGTHWDARVVQAAVRVLTPPPPVQATPAHVATALAASAS